MRTAKLVADLQASAFLVKGLLNCDKAIYVNRSIAEENSNQAPAVFVYTRMRTLPSLESLLWLLALPGRTCLTPTPTRTIRSADSYDPSAYLTLDIL
jgi:hypothetical protein